MVTIEALVEDEHGRIFGVMNGEYYAVNAFDGDEIENLGDFAPDLLGQGLLLEHNPSKPTGEIFDYEKASN